MCGAGFAILTGRNTINKMYWADELANQIITSGKYKPYWVDDMKTPSGRVHIGSVRAVLTHELICRALKDRKKDVTFSYVLDDHDPMDSLPTYLDEKEYRQHLGKPLYQIPSPEKGYDSYGQRWGQEYIEIFNSLDVHPEIIWGSQLYRSGKMNDSIKTCLDQAEAIRTIYKTIYKKGKPENWFPFSVACEQCGKLSTTVVTGWDGEQVSYECNPHAVVWTEGCGHHGRVSPFNGSGKLPWKIEWACKWKVIGVTVEGAGKDHMTAGGSHDVARLICERVIHYPVPFPFSHEFFLVGGRKMSSSKGLGSSAKEVSEILPPYLIRFMIARVKYNRAINFDPAGMTIPDLFDEYDHAARAFWQKKDKRLARIYEISQVKGSPSKNHFLPRFREIASIIQHPGIDAEERFSKLKGSKFTGEERRVLEERVKYAKIWLAQYAPEEQVFSLTTSISKAADRLSLEQKEFLAYVEELLSEEWKKPEDLQQALYERTKKMKIPTAECFEAIYLALIGKTHGPRAAWFLLENRKLVLKRLKEVSKKSLKTTRET